MIESSTSAARVSALRLWGTETLYDLPESTRWPLLLWSSRTCSIRLTGRDVAPEHARLTLDGDQWLVCGLRVHQDGVPSPGFVLTPGVEVGLGGVTLVAESEQMRRLRAFCRRLLGWSEGRMRTVDHALRAIRLARAHRTALVLTGEGDLVPIAYALHRFAIGDHAPFIVSDRAQRETPASIRGPANLRGGIEAFACAAGGTLCLRDTGQPVDIDEVKRRAYAPDSDVQLVVCTHAEHRSASVSNASSTIEIPPLQLRERELSRIVREYADDASTALQADPGHFLEEDCDWVMAHFARSLAEIEKATLRIVALGASQTRSQAALRLGIAPVSLIRWLDRRPWRAFENRAACCRGDRATGSGESEPSGEHAA